MSVQRLLLVPLIAIAVAMNAQAGPRRPKPGPDVLIETLKTNPDERARAAAIEDLRDYDLKNFPDILPAWIEALQHDSSVDVRLAAARSIGGMRPISQQGGFALERAAHTDPSWLVRGAANRNLGTWKLFFGYRPGRAPVQQNFQTGEPPLAAPLPPIKATPLVAPPTNPGPPAMSPPPRAPATIPPIPPAPNTLPPIPTAPAPSSPAVPEAKDQQPRPPLPLIQGPAVSKPPYSRSPLELIPAKNRKSTPAPAENQAPAPPPVETGPSLNPPM